MEEKDLRPVLVECAQNGQPTAIVWEGKRYEIDAVIAEHRDVYRKAGRIGTRYTVVIRGQRRELFYSPRPRPAVWLLEIQPRRPKPGARHCCADLRWEKFSPK